MPQNLLFLMKSFVPCCFRAVLLIAMSSWVLAAETGKGAPPAPEPKRFSKPLKISKKHLILPICNKAEECVFEFEVGGRKRIRTRAQLAPDADSADFWAYFPMKDHQGKEALISIKGPASKEAFALIGQSDEIPGEESFYTESQRPQLRFSQKVGWNNDVNGLVYHQGEWHLFFQYCPTAHRHSDKFWGHAVSKDLVHWEELPIALYPHTQAKGQCFSGSAMVDHHNMAGFQTGDEPPILAFFSDFGAGVGEAIAYSNDRGRSFTYYENNPVLKHRGNDPRVIWYAYDDDDEPLSDEAEKLGGHWVLASYNNEPKHGKNIAFFTSTDLKNWTHQSHLPGYAECPEILELPVEPLASNKAASAKGAETETRWVVFGANAEYAIGDFDGRAFTPEHEGKYRVHYGQYFGSQVFSNAPDGRAIQIGWAKIRTTGMPFTQTFTLPHRLTLHEAPEGIRLHTKPVVETEQLRLKAHAATASEIAADTSIKVEAAGELFEIRAEFAIGQAKSVGLKIGEDHITYDVESGKLNGAPMKPLDGKVTMQVFVDRPMMEICGNEGAVYITSARKAGNKRLKEITAFANGGPAHLLSMEVHELKSIWQNEPHQAKPGSN